jgi:hypothetical protein
VAGAAGTHTTTGAAGVGASTAAAGYRLSGADMSQWSGRRVQIVGTLVPASAGANGAASAAGSAGAAGTSLPEFRVLTVRPATGNCQQR